MVQQERISCSAGPPAFSYSATFSDLERLYIRNWKSQGICPPRRQQMADLAIVVVVVIFPTGLILFDAAFVSLRAVVVQDSQHLLAALFAIRRQDSDVFQGYRDLIVKPDRIARSGKPIFRLTII